MLYHSETKYWKNGGTPVYGSPSSYSSADLDYADSYSTTSYIWRDAARQSSVSLTNRDGSSTSSYSYNRYGNLAHVGISGGTRPRTIHYQNDTHGQIVIRGEADAVPGQADPFTHRYMFGGVVMGEVGNDGTSNVDYATGIAMRSAAPGSGAFRGGATTGTAYADFDANFSQINGDTNQSPSSSYTIRQGDSLASIAASLWGDASLWYKLADANGISGPSTGSGSVGLAVGRSLVIPGSITNIHNNAATFKPYDPAEAIGNTSPNTPKPPKAKNSCGAFGQILMVVVAVAVAAIAGPAAIAAFSTATTSYTWNAGLATPTTTGVLGSLPPFWRDYERLLMNVSGS